MFRIEKIVLNSGLISLIGFAKKAGEMDTGFEAVRRGVQKGKTAFILLDESIAANSLRRITAMAKRQDTPVYIVAGKTADSRLFEITGNKILGMHRGGLSRGFSNKLRDSERNKVAK